MSTYANIRRTRRAKKEVVVIDPFKRDVAVSYFSQDAVAALHSLIIDTKNSNGWSQSDIASRIGMDETQISRLMSGRQTNMTVETIALLALAMDHEVNLQLRPLDEEREVEAIDKSMNQYWVRWDDDSENADGFDIDTNVATLEKSLAHAN